MGFLVVYLERHIQTIDYFFFLLWNLLILILQIMEHLTAGTTFFFMFVFISFFFYCSPRIGAKVKDAFSAFVGKRKHIRRRIYRLG